MWLSLQPVVFRTATTIRLVVARRPSTLATTASVASPWPKPKNKSPAKEKVRDKARVKDAETFGAYMKK